LQGLSRATLAAIAAIAMLAWATPAGAKTTERVSLSSTCQPGNNLSASPGMSADGRYVVFESDASNLVPGDGNAFTDIFVRDRQTGTTEIVSVSTLGAQADGRSYEPAITPDGRYVVFTSEATTLLDGGGDTNGRNDVFLRDRLFRTTERVSISSAEDQGTGPSGGGFSVGISDDGRFVVFPSHARNFAPGGVSNGFEQIYVRDRCVSNGNPVDGCIPGTVRVSESTAGDEGNSTSQRPVISGNGRFVAFESDAWNLVPGDTSPFDFPPGHRDVFVHDLQTDITERVSLSTTSDPGNGDSDFAALSYDGRYVAFGSAASNLVPGDRNGWNDVFVRDRQAGTTERVSVSSTGGEGTSFSGFPVMTPDARFVVFGSYGFGFVVPPPTNSFFNTFVHDRLTGATELVSVTATGGEADGESFVNTGVSADGRFVAFASAADDLVADDTPAAFPYGTDVFVRDRAEGFVTRSCTSLLLDGQPYRPIGLNIYNANSNGWCWYQMDGSILDDSLTAIGPGKNAMRAWFFQQLATTNGARDWTAFDRTLATARAHGYKVIATLTDQWGDCGDSTVAGYGYKDKRWYQSAYTYRDPSGTVSYRDWVAEVVSRYENDPTILAWQLVNEPEVLPYKGADCSTVPESTAESILSSFAGDVSGLIKSIDPNHLVSLGTIGSGQCGTQDTDYKTVMSVPTLDLCEYHDYDYNHLIPGDQWNGLQRRIEQCNDLDKPLIVGELGVIPDQVGGTLDDRANVVAGKLCAQLRAGVAGELLWAWDKNGSTSDNFDIGPNDPVLDALSPWSDASHSCSAPEAPSGLVAAAGDGSAAVSWLAPDSDGGSPVTSYTVTSSPGGITKTVGGSTAHATVAGLANGTVYTFSVAASNAAGTGAASSPSNAVTPQAGYPAPAAATGTASTTTVTTVSTGSDPTLTGGTTSSVIVPEGTSGGVVSLTQSGTSVAAPSGYQLGNVQIQISAPAATATNPLTLVFTITPTAGQTVDSTQVYRTDAGTTTLVPSCDNPSTHQAVPDPCVSNKGSVTINGASYIQVTVLTSTASIWNVATPVPANISVSGSGYSPPTAGLAFGGTANWSFAGKKAHSVTDAFGLGAGGAPVFDSGPLGAGKRYSFRFVSAGSYVYKSIVKGDSTFPTGVVAVPAQVTPAAGGTTTRFTVIWASTRPSGYVFDLRYRFKPAGSTGWKNWATWKNGVSTISSGFVPNQGAGTYTFRARLRNQSTGRASDYSPDVMVSVS